MLVSKQHATFCDFPSFHIPDSINDLAKRGLKELLYLLLPEESFENPGGRKDKTTGLETTNARSIIKGLFWIVVSIGISLAMGNLQ
jgi:hypothetical protein